MCEYSYLVEDRPAVPGPWQHFVDQSDLEAPHNYNLQGLCRLLVFLFHLHPHIYLHHLGHLGYIFASLEGVRMRYLQGWIFQNGGRQLTWVGLNGLCWMQAAAACLA